MKGYIYKLHDNTNNTDYYGSTIQTLNKRLQEHKNKLDCSSKSIIENNDYIMILVETIEFQDKKQLLEREKYYIQNYPCINKYSPLRTKEEYKEQQKEYYEEHKEQQKEYYQEYRELNKEKLLKQRKEYYEANKEQKKEYREKHKEQINEYKKEYYERNKEQINEQKKEKVVCECGSIISRGALLTHKKRKKHLNYINSINEIN